MFEIKACTVCLSTNVNCINMDIGEIRREYNIVSGLETYTGNGLPAYLCIECATYVKRFAKFRNKCQRAHYTLLQILETNHQITESILNELNRNRIKVNPTLTYIDATNPKVKIETIESNLADSNRTIQDGNTSSEIYVEVPKARTDETQNKPSTHQLKNIHNIIEKDESHSDDGFDGTENDNTDLSCFDNQNDLNDYATAVAISEMEAQAVMDVQRRWPGKCQCAVCGEACSTKARLKVHMQLHDMASGKFSCELCRSYYRKEFQLKSHISENHKFKYICSKCPEVTFNRTLAKQHYLQTHLPKGVKRKSDQCKTKQLLTKCKKKKSKCVPGGKTRQKQPSDFPMYTPISQKEQYEIVQERQFSKNYLNSAFKCNQCYRGFQESRTYENHMKKHDQNLSGKYQCDVCKEYVVNTRQMYKHMVMRHLYKYSCQFCTFICFNQVQAQLHYKWHKNVKYSCPHCKMEFTKASSRLSHIRIKHPSTFICTLCGHSFVSEKGLHCHKRIVHTKEEIAGETKQATDSALYCGECQLQFRDEAAFATHLGSSNKHADTNLSVFGSKKSNPNEDQLGFKKGRGRRGKYSNSKSYVVNTGSIISTTCKICDKVLRSDVQVRKHYETEHPGADYLKRYMCEICAHTFRDHSSLTVHMRSHTQEKPYACPHCERRFTTPGNRERHLLVHTGEKPFECNNCNRRFSHKTSMKLHIQTVHLKIPYPPWNKKNRKKKRNSETAVQLHKHDPQGDYINAYMLNL